MTTIKLSQKFKKGLDKLGFAADDELLFLTEKDYTANPQAQFHLERAKDFQADAVYLRKQLNGSYKPQAYLFDYTQKIFVENELTDIQKIVWSSGEAPLVCVFYATEIKIINCTTHINDDFTPVYLVKDLQISGKAHKLYNEHFATKLIGGTFWEEEENKAKFKFQNSSYDKLIENVRYIIAQFKSEYLNITADRVNKIIVQAILIKYLEERIDDNGNKLLSNKYFKKYDNSKSFNDVLRRKGKFAELVTDLNDPVRGFNGNLFHWDTKEKDKIAKMDLRVLADLLDTDSSLHSKQRELWRYFEFKFIPVELISRLYEEFLGQNKKENGLYYTPSHLAQLLVDECIPLTKYGDIEVLNYKVLDPACGSGIFLVITFKRLVQLWRLQNNMALPELPVLKKILSNLHGVDQENQAVRLASFSLCLALCNELKPIDIINKLKFDDLTENNLIHSDFFSDHNLPLSQFDLIIGNPPFGVGAIKKYTPNWEYLDKKVKIPQGQIALKFLSEGLTYLKPNGLLCLIIKASGLLYNSTSKSYKTLLFSELNVVQILDFTALGRNRALWDNGADVSSAAIFIKNEKPDFRKNILHLTFKRTRATKERIVFEIDDYDLHFVNRQVAISNQSVWKNNLLGGGRIASVLEKNKLVSFEGYLTESKCIFGEGFKIGSKGQLNPDFIYELKTLPTEAINEKSIDLNQLIAIKKTTRFEKLPQREVFTAPNVVIWENIGQERLPIHLNTKSFSFQHKIIGIHNKNQHVLTEIVRSFKEHNDFYRFAIFVTSGQVLINLNTVILKTDLMNMPFVRSTDTFSLSKKDKNIIADVNNYMEEFIRHGEGAKALQPIPRNELSKFITKYGEEFSDTLNEVYHGMNKHFALSEIVLLDSSFIATIFKYKKNHLPPVFHEDKSVKDLEKYSTLSISKHLAANRIIKLYPAEDVIVFIKPNQHRYWLSINAYRDADKCLTDLAKLGY